jgi:hypothetical protein
MGKVKVGLKLRLPVLYALVKPQGKILEIKQIVTAHSFKMQS